MIFVLVIVVLDFFVRVLKILFELFNPLSHDSQHCIWFDEENPVFNLFLSIELSVFWYFSADQIFCVTFHLISIKIIIMGQLNLLFDILILFFSPFVNWNIYFFKRISHKTDKSIVLLVPSLYHKIYHSHYLSSVISIFPVTKWNPWVADQIVFASSLVVDLRKNAPKC